MPPAPLVTHPPPLYNHLRHTCATQRLAADKGLALDASHKVASGREGEEHSGGNQARRARNDGEPVDNGHDGIGARAHVVRRDLADGGIEAGRGRADAQEQGHLDEEDDEGEDESDDAEDEKEGVKGEDVGNTEGKAEDHGQDAEPLPVDAKVARRKFLFQRHLGDLLQDGRMCLRGWCAGRVMVVTGGCFYSRDGLLTSGMLGK